MPMTYGAATTNGSVRFVDFNNQPGSLGLSAGDVTKLKAGLELVNAISNASITEVHSTIVEPVTGGSNTPVFGGQREYLMRFECTLANGKIGYLDIPAPKSIVLQSGDKRLVDLAQTDVAAFVAWAVAGANGVKVGSQAISAINSAWVLHKESKTEIKKRKIG